MRVIHDMEVWLNCRLCKHSERVVLESEKLIAWQSRKVKIQEAFPHLTAGQRELMISGTCDACWKKMFGGGNES